MGQIVLSQNDVAQIIADHLKAQGKKATRIRFRAITDTKPPADAKPAADAKPGQRPVIKPGTGGAIFDAVFGSSLFGNDKEPPAVKLTGIRCEVEIKE